MGDDDPVLPELFGRVDQGEDGHRGAVDGDVLGHAGHEAGACPGPRAVVDEDDDIVDRGRILAHGASADDARRRFQAEAHRVTAAVSPRDHREAARTKPGQRFEAVR